MAKTNYNLHLKGYVGGWDFDSGYVDYVLGQNSGKPVQVLIDSTGGSLATALSVVAAFRNHGDVSVHFVGMNASAATIASLGAKHISIDSSAMYLVHKCSSGFFEYGSFNSDQLKDIIDSCRQMKNDLDKMDANVAEMYAAKCKKDPAELMKLMKVGGWLTAKEALDWGFVDEITDREEDTNSAPRLTEAVVASMSEAGIPIPNIPIADKTSGFGKFMAALASFFNQSQQLRHQQSVEEKVPEAKAQEPEGKHEQPKPEPNLIKTPTMNKTFTAICGLLSVEALAEIDGTISMTADNLRLIEDTLKQKDDALKANEDTIKLKDDTIALKEEALRTKDERITALEAQVEALKAAPGSSTTQVVDEKGGEDAQSEVEKYVDSMNSAREMFNNLP